MAYETFIPTLWSARLLKHKEEALVAKSFYNNDYEGEIRDSGSTVRINQIGPINIFDYDRNGTLNPPEKANVSALELIIDKAKAFNFFVDDIDAAQAKINLMDSQMQVSGYSLAENEDLFLFALLCEEVATENKIEATITSTNDMYDLIIKMRTLMAKNRVPAPGRVLALPPEAVALLLKDDRFVGTGGIAAEATLATGLIGRAAGFDIFEVNTTPDSKMAIAGHRSAATYASQIIKTEAYRPQDGFKDALKGLSVYGAKVLYPTSIAVAELTIELD